MIRTLRVLWNEPRAPHPPVRGRGDWVLVGALLVWSVLEAVLRDEFGLLVLTERPDDPAWRPLVLIVSVVIAATLLWRRSHPLGAVAVAFGTIIAFDVARIFLIDAAGLTSVAALLLLPYSLFRWGSGREWAIGLGFVVVWLVTTHVADPTEVRDVVSTVGFFLFSAALGASVRFHRSTRARDIEQAKLRERNQLARELHDMVGHHVSAIAIQAQGGRMMVASNPDRALNALETIEQAASRALIEMRAMVGMLRDGGEPDFSPQPGASDIEGLAGRVDGQPEIEVRVSGDLDGLSPAVDVALYRIAQEAITNATRHARHATQIVVDVERKGEEVHLTVRDDGDVATSAQNASGYGLVGMAERASLLGGSLRAGPHRQGGWTVAAVFPTEGASR
jgi:signal transduction histidine kinase